MSAEPVDISVAKASIEKMLAAFAGAPCNHKRMKFSNVPFEGGYYVAFTCPLCAFSGAMHPQQFEAYQKL